MYTAQEARAAAPESVVMAGGRGGRRCRIDVRVRPRPVPITPRVREVCSRFGLDPQPRPAVLIDRQPLTLAPGRILLLTGPSGTGKSAALRCLASQVGPRGVWVDRQEPAARRAVIDEVLPGGSLAEAVSILTACGLGEPRLWLRRYGELSDGERFRVRLAGAVGRAAGMASPVILADEFAAVLHRRLARAVAVNLRKLVTSRGIAMAAATAQDDLEGHLQPDLVLRLGAAEPVLETPDHDARSDALLQSVRIERGSLKDYHAFDAMHYRRREGLGPIDKIFVLRECGTGDALGVVVYGYPPLSLRPRNLATGGRYHRQGALLNRDFRILRRLVIHPDVRGCGLARHLVARTLPRVGTRYVECLAAMGAVNPVFERAGMVRLGLTGARGPGRAVLAALGADPLAPDFERQVRDRREVRNLVARWVHRWLQATTGRPIERIRAMTPRQLAAACVQMAGPRPVYYLWSAEAKERARLREMRDAARKGID